MAEKTPWANSNKIILGLGIIVVLAVIIIVGFYGMGKPSVTTTIATTAASTVASTTSMMTTSSSTTSVPTGPAVPHEIILGYHQSSITVPAGSEKTINFTIPAGAIQGSLNGTYTATSGIEAATLTAAEYTAAVASSWAALASEPDYYGSGTTATIATPLSPGNYSLVFYNPGSSADNVTYSQTILLSYYTYG